MNTSATNPISAPEIATTSSISPQSKRVKSVYEYVGITEKELSFKIGEEFEVLDSSHSDWWFLKSLKGGDAREGYAPKTYLAEVATTINTGPEQKITPNTVPTGDNSTGGVKKVSPNIHVNIPTQGREDESEEDEDEDEDENSEATEEEEEEEEDEDEEEEDSEDDDKDLRLMLKDLMKRKSVFKYRKVRLAGPEKTQLANLPAGFRASALSRCWEQGNGRPEQFLTPELSGSGLAFKDLHISRKTQVRKRDVKCNLAFSIIDAKNVSNPTPLKVVGRMVRLALYDKSNIVSNIHTVPAFLGADNENVWKFSTKASVLFPRDDENSCFLRTIEVDIKLCLLFELVLVVRKMDDPTSTQTIDISCGWSLLPLFSSDGKDVESKTYDMQIFGGGPSERDVLLAGPVPKDTGFFAGFKSTSASSRLPRLSIKVWKLNKTSVNQLNDLPDVFVGNLNAVPIVAFYRRVLANTLVGNGRDRDGQYGSIYEPILALIPRIMEQTDLMTFLVNVWTKKLKGMPRRDKSSYAALRNHFTAAVLIIWPLLFTDLPKYIPGNIENTVARGTVWQQLQNEGAISFLSKSTLNVRRFDTNELEYSYLKSIAKVVPSGVQAPTLTPVGTQLPLSPSRLAMSPSTQFPLPTPVGVLLPRSPSISNP